MITAITLIYIIVAIISIVFMIRFWMTMSRIKDIRDLLIKQNKSPEEPQISYEIESDEDIDNSEVEGLKAKLKPGQCVVYVKRTQKIEIWKKSDWDDVVKIGNEKFFKLVYKNF